MAILHSPDSILFIGSVRSVLSCCSSRDAQATDINLVLLSQMVETKGLDFIDAEKAKHAAKEQNEEILSQELSGSP